MNAQPSGNARPLHILLAVDGSGHAQAAAQLLHDLPLPEGSEVTALAVYQPRRTPSHAALMDALDRASHTLWGTMRRDRVGILHGHPAEALVHYADVHRVDLIVMGAQGLHASLGILLGGVAQQVVEYANQPVLVARKPYRGLRRVLLAVDGSPASDQALNYLAQFPLPRDAEVRVMHVLPPSEEIDLALLGHQQEAEVIVPPETANQYAAELREAQALVARATDRLKQAGFAAETLLTRGSPADEIIEAVNANGINLIVVGSRGLSAIRGWWLGSVSRKLVHYSGCSVLVVKPPPAPNE